MHRAPLLLPALALLTAIVAETHGWARLTFAAALLAAPWAPAVAVGAGAGVVAGHVWGHPPVVTAEGRTERYRGTIVGDIVPAEDGRTRSFPLRVDDVGTVRASTRESVAAGEQLVVVGRLEPLDEPRNPGEPSLRAIALDDGVIGAMIVRRVVARAPPSPIDLAAHLAIVRAQLSASTRAALPEPEATMLAGALWGERGTLPPSLRDDFTATGTVHVLVTAGLHCGVIAATCAAFFALLRLGRVRGALLTIPVVFAYAALSGWHIPAERAATMIAVGLVARACGARTVSLNTLALAAIVVALSRPVAVASVSFAMSFSCVGAIVLFAPPIAEALAARRAPAFVAHAVALTAATQIGVWPLTAAIFGTLAPYAILANAIVVPAVGAVLVVGIAAIVTHPVAVLSSACIRWENWLLTLILAVTHGIAQLPGAHAGLRPPPPWWSIAAYDTLAVIAAIAVAGRRARWCAAMLIMASLQVVIASRLAEPRGDLRITALDVGQGDAIVIRTPTEHTVLIDTGGRLENGPTVDGSSPAQRAADRVLLPYLLHAGIARVDLLVITHPHGDHAGGIAGIVRSVPVGRIADSGQSYGGHAFNDGLREARSRGVPIAVPRCDERWIDGDVTLAFLSPCGPPFADGTNDVNENSLVVLLTYGGVRALFMGDAGFLSEGRLLAQGVDLHADILKVGHHGSAYSSSAAFIAAVHPRLALISVGRRNRFGHPAPATLEAFEREGTRIYRTDRCGAITIVASKAATLPVSTMLPCAAVAR